MRRKVTYEPSDYFSQLLLLDCVVKIRDKYDGTLGQNKKGADIPFLSKTFDRKIIKQQYTLASLIDDEIAPFCKTAKSKALLKKSRMLKISNHSEVKRWSAKVKALIMLVISIDHRAFVDDRVAHSAIADLVKTKLSLKGRMTYLFKFARLTTSKPTTYLVKAVISALRKHYPKKYKAILKQGEFTSDEVKNFDMVSQTVKRASNITHETHPEYYTIEKPHEKLTVPIPNTTTPIFSKDEDTDAQWYAMWEDPNSGEWVTTYKESDRKQNDQKKWENVKAFVEQYKDIKKRIKENIGSKDYNTRVRALMVGLIQLGSFRIGNKNSEKDGVRGLGTLLKKHITLDGKNATFSYVGKKKKNDKITLTLTPQALKILKSCLSKKKKNDYVFTAKNGKRITASSINRFLKENLKVPDGVSIHKFRHANATIKARQVLRNPPFDKNTPYSEKMKWYRAQLELVRAFIRHDTINTTKESYIDPDVIERFEKRWKLRKEDIEASKAKAKKARLTKKKKSLAERIKKLTERISKKRETIDKIKEGKLTAKKKERLKKLRSNIKDLKQKRTELREQKKNL